MNEYRTFLSGIFSGGRPIIFSFTTFKDNFFKLIKNQHWFQTSEVCNGLPPDISNLATEQTFPVSYNTAVTVSCSGDSELRGDNIITCNQGTDFKFSVKPKCNEMGQWQNIFCLISSFRLVFFEILQLVYRIFSKFKWSAKKTRDEKWLFFSRKTPYWLLQPTFVKKHIIYYYINELFKKEPVLSYRKKATCGQTQCFPSRKELCWSWTVSGDTPSLLEREYSRAYRTPSILCGDTFRLVLSVGEITLVLYSGLKTSISLKLWRW